MNRKIWIVMLAAAFGWGTGGVATRSVLLHGVDPFTLIPVRYVISALLLAGWLLWTKRFRLSKGSLVAGLVIGTVNMSGPTFFFTLALEDISAGLGGLLTTLIPMATAVWAHFVLADEPFNVKKLAGLVVAFGGVTLLVLTGQSGIAGGDPVLGVGISLIAITLASLGGVLSRVYAQRYGIMELAGPQFVVAAVVSVLVGVVLGTTPIGAIGLPSWLLLFYLATVGTVVPFVTFLWVVQHTTATRASLIGYLIPLISLLTGALFLGEHLTLLIGAAAVLIFAGVIMVDRAEPTRLVNP